MEKNQIYMDNLTFLDLLIKISTKSTGLGFIWLECPKQLPVATYFNDIKII